MESNNRLKNSDIDEKKMTLLNCFWSYSHEDEEHDQRIIPLINDITNELKAITGYPVGKYFLDKDSLNWGEVLMDKIDQSIATFPIFIPFITPTYFNRPNCRYEMRTFLEKLDGEFGSSQYALLPIHYIDVPELTSEETDDELIKRVKAIYWEDWRDTRFEERSSSKYRKKVNQIAFLIKQKNDELETQIVSKETSLIEEALNNAEEEELGFFEIAINMNESITDISSSLQNATSSAEEISRLMTEEFTQKIEGRNMQHSGILFLLNVLSKKLVEPVETLYEEATIFSNKMGVLNYSMPIFINGLQTIDTPSTPQKETICGVWKSMHSLRDTFVKLKDAIEYSIYESEKMARLSSTIRPVLRKQNSELNLIIESMMNYSQVIESLDFLNSYCS